MKIKGNKKDNTLVGEDGDDKILGLGGDDTITAKGGHDTVDAGSGNDKIKIAANTSAAIDAGKGDDLVTVTAGALGSSIDLGKGNDSVQIAESSQSDQSFSIDGGKGDNSVNFALDQASYTITENGDAAYTVVDANGNSYELSSISALTFNGVSYIPPVVEPNQAPVLNTPIADQAATVNTAYSFQVGANAFTDPDNDTLVYTATLSDGSALPSWLTFDAATRTFSGTPTSAGSVTVRVTASDGSLTASDDFVIGVTGGGTGGGPVFVNTYGDLDNQHLDGQGTPDGELYAGHGNPATGFALGVNNQAGIELGLDVRYRYDATEIAPDVGINTWHVSAENLNNLRFAYSAGAEQGLSNYDVRLSIDTDGSDGENFFALNLGPDQGGNVFSNNGDSQFDWYNSNGQAVIADDGGDAAGQVTQNIQALQWYQQEGLEAGDEFQIKLEAFEQGTGTKLAGTQITIKIDGHTERALEDFDGNSDMVLTDISGVAYGNVALTGQDTAIITQTNDDPVDGAGPFTRFDHYRTDTPDVVTTSVDINIKAADIGSGEGFAYSVAANNTSGSHLRDFVFNVANNGTGVKVGASTGAGTGPADLSGPGNASLSDGWYTFQHTMYENASGDLEVELTVIDRDTGVEVFSQTISQASDDFSIYGGNRYGWFAEIDVNEGLEIDNWALAAQYF